MKSGRNGRPNGLLRSRNAAHGINRNFRMAVLLHARTIETNRAIHLESESWRESLGIAPPAKCQEEKGRQRNG